MKRKIPYDRDAVHTPHHPTGAFPPFQSIRHHFPPAFLLLCQLFKLTPAELLHHFANDCIGLTPHSKQEAVSNHLLPYLSCRYSGPQYSSQNIQHMLQELQAMGRLFPEGDDELIKIYGHWRDKYHMYWFNKWVGSRGRP